MEVGAEVTALACLAGFAVGAISSTIDAHSLQSGHRPSHFGDSYPHDWQTYLVCDFAIGVILSEGAGDRQGSRLLLAGFSMQNALSYRLVALLILCRLIQKKTQIRSSNLVDTP